MKPVLMGLAFFLSLGSLVHGADRRVDKLEAYMKKWENFEPGKYPKHHGDQPLLLAALAQEPAGPWSAYLVMQYAGTSYALRGLPDKQRQSTAAKAVDPLRQAEVILSAAIQRGETNVTELQTERALVQEVLNPLVLEAGPAYLPEARSIAEDMLAKLPSNHFWNYGNLVYAGNQLLGRVALREGKLDEARRYLHQAGQAPGSPQLNCLGPDNVLARELLHHGAPADRQAVLAYLTEIAHFWTQPRPAQGAEAAQDRLRKLNQWTEEIRAGMIPDDPQWR